MKLKKKKYLTSRFLTLVCLFSLSLGVVAWLSGSAICYKQIGNANFNATCLYALHDNVIILDSNTSAKMESNYLFRDNNGREVQSEWYAPYGDDSSVLALYEHRRQVLALYEHRSLIIT